MKAAQITSSIKLQFKNVVTIKPWLLLNLLDEEFVSTDMYADAVDWQTPIAHVIFGKVKGRIFEINNDYVLVLEDGRIYSFTPPVL